MKKKISRILGVALTVTLLASLLLSASPVIAITSPTVTVPFPTAGSNSISGAGHYTITFGTFPTIPAAGTITVRFPAGTTAPALVPGAMTVNGVPVVAAVWTLATRTLVITNPAGIVGPANVVVNIPPAAAVMNPGSPGTYTLEVRTQPEPTYVTSNSYTIIIPPRADRYNPLATWLPATWLSPFSPVPATLSEVWLSATT
jgi:hypothetical protein